MRRNELLYSTEKMKKINYFLLLSCIFLFHLTINYQIIKKSQVLRALDEPLYLYSGFTCYKGLFSDSLVGIANRMDNIFIKSPGGRQRNGFYLIEAISWKIEDILRIKDEDLMILITNSIFLLILLISIYGIGSILYDRNIGLLAALITSMFPLAFGHSRVAMTDYPLMCMVSLSIYLLLKTNEFRSIPYSIFAGMALGVSQFTKETSIIFILFPLIYYFIKAYSSEEKKKVLVNFTITILSFFIIAIAVFFKTTDLHVFKNFWKQITGLSNKDSFYYFKSFFANAVGPFFLILSLPLLLSYLINIRKRDKLLFLWFIIPFILFSVSTNKMNRFLMPILPAVALIMAQELAVNTFSKAFKTALKVFLIPCLVLQYIFINAGLVTNQHYKDQFEYGIVSVKKEPYFPVSLALLEIFKKETLYSRDQKKVLFLFLNAKIVSPMWYKFSVYELPLDFYCPMMADITSAPASGTVNWKEEVLTADYIVDKTGILPDEIKGRYENVADQLQEGFKKYKNRFKEVGKIKADSFDIYVYKRIKI